MEKYWNMISPDHSQKLKDFVEGTAIDQNVAMGNIVKYVENHSKQELPDYMEGIAKINDIEDMIDIVARWKEGHEKSNAIHN